MTDKLDKGLKESVVAGLAGASLAASPAKTQEFKPHEMDPEPKGTVHLVQPSDKQQSWTEAFLSGKKLEFDSKDIFNPPEKQKPWTPEGLHEELHPIARLESRFGQDMNHAKSKMGSWHTAVGAVGLKPITAHEEYLRWADLRERFPGLEDPVNFEIQFKNNWMLYNTIASKHWSRLMALTDGDPARAAFSWRYGLTAQKNASQEQIDSSEYVQKYRQMFHELQAKKVKKNENLQKSYTDIVEIVNHAHFKGQSKIVPWTSKGLDPRLMPFVAMNSDNLLPTISNKDPFNSRKGPLGVVPSVLFNFYKESKAAKTIFPHLEELNFNSKLDTNPGFYNFISTLYWHHLTNMFSSLNRAICAWIHNPSYAASLDEKVIEKDPFVVSYNNFWAARGNIQKSIKKQNDTHQYLRKNILPGIDLQNPTQDLYDRLKEEYYSTPYTPENISKFKQLDQQLSQIAKALYQKGEAKVHDLRLVDLPKTEQAKVNKEELQNMLGQALKAGDLHNINGIMQAMKNTLPQNEYQNTLNDEIKKHATRAPSEVKFQLANLFTDTQRNLRYALLKNIHPVDLVRDYRKWGISDAEVQDSIADNEQNIPTEKLYSLLKEEHDRIHGSIHNPMSKDSPELLRKSMIHWILYDLFSGIKRGEINESNKHQYRPFDLISRGHTLKNIDIEKLVRENIVGKSVDHIIDTIKAIELMNIDGDEKEKLISLISENPSDELYHRLYDTIAKDYGLRYKAIPKINFIDYLENKEKYNSIYGQNAERAIEGTVNVPVIQNGNSHKLRIARDTILASGKQELHPKLLPPGNWSEFRLPNGNISADLIQKKIDSSKTAYKYRYSQWEPAVQRHSNENSNVFQLHATPELLKQIEDAGLKPLYNAFYNLSKKGGHPVSNNTSIGWVRWTGNKKGVQIDEIQTDVAPSNLAYIASVYPEFAQHKEQTKQLQKILFQGKHPSELIHEAFLQGLRDGGWHDTPVHIHDVNAKVELAGLDKNKEPPAHFKEGYRDIPKKMGYQPAQYGTLETQQNPSDEMQVADKTQHAEKVRKFEE